MDEDFGPLDAIDKTRLKALCRRSDVKGLARLIQHGAALAATATLVALAQDTLWLVPALWLHGVVLVFLFAPLHETIHRTAFEHRRLNDAVAWVAGALLVLPPGYFRAFHFAHHRFTQDPARDPELAVARPHDLRSYLWIASGLPFWAERLTTTVKQATGRIDAPFIPERQHPAIRREARVLLALYGAVAGLSLAFGSWAAVTYWILPALLGQPALRLYLLAEHGACPLVPDMLKNSRTTKTNGLVRQLAWNMPFHSAHHAYPAVPFHALPQAHELLAPRIPVLSSGYVAAHREILSDFPNRHTEAQEPPS
jgi:fatty acid desaturase